MGRNNYFQFKQFIVQQEQSAMKVGTDGVLLGSWASVANCKQILDVGTGTGVIALMMAQRSQAQITALEIENNAAIEATRNVANSEWESRIEVRHISFQEFAKTSMAKYDLIVSNPPFFSRSQKTGNNERNLARHNDSLLFSELISYSAELLTACGCLAIIVPVEAINEIETCAAAKKLYLARKTAIQPNISKLANRFLLEFSKKKSALKKDCLIIYDEVGVYSDSYKNLTKDFYLNF